MFFPFLSRLFSKRTANTETNSDLSEYSEVALATGGVFYTDLRLYLYDKVTPVDLLLFLPYHGLYAGERVSWRADELEGASVERFVRGGKKKASTRFDAVETALRQKLEHVLSFDSTPCERFVWMENLTEEEFDALDSSFHALLPKERVIFAGESSHAIRKKLESLSPLQIEPYSLVKVIGSINSHEMLLPTNNSPFGSFLSDEQLSFLNSGFADSVTTLCGPSGSGKSTLLLRKAIRIVLEDPKKTVLIITPTLLAGELLRNKLVSLMEYGAFTVPLNSVVFYTPQSAEPLEENEAFSRASAILCDDAYRLDEKLVEMIERRRGSRWVLLSTALCPEAETNLFLLQNRYREAKHFSTLRCPQESLIFALIMELRRRLGSAPANDIMVVLPEQGMLLRFKEAIDEYFGLNCRTLVPGFSLQYQNLDDMVLATTDYISGLRIPHLILIAPEGEEDYSFELSRASETATIITYPKPDGEDGEKNR